MRSFFLIALSCISLHAFTQDCSKELLRQKTGIWKAGQQGSIHNVSATDLVKEKALIAGIHKMVSTNYSPMGCQVSYSTVYGKHMAEGLNWIADPYYYAMYILRYLCDGNSTDKDWLTFFIQLPHYFQQVFYIQILKHILRFRKCLSCYIK